MEQRRWRQVRKIFNEALRHDAGERDVFLDSACAGDIDLRIEVESLLISLADARTFLEQPLISESGGKFETWQLSEGQTLSHYRIISPIATGGMGEVYLAEDEKLHRQVALKILPKVIFGNEERLRRFKREAELVSALNHPNILTVYEFGNEENLHFLACEFVNGETLREKLGNGRFNCSEILEIAVQITTALQAAHSAGVVHRDIKPENVMIRNDGYVKVLDFGLAKYDDAASVDLRHQSFSFFSQPGIIMGTATYMSPEQARGMVVDNRSDLFSLGIVMYEMFAGRVPFSGDTTTDVIAAILQDEIVAICKVCPEVPAEIDGIIGRLLQKEKIDRYQSAADLLIDLKKIKAIQEAVGPKIEIFSDTIETNETEISRDNKENHSLMGSLKRVLGRFWHLIVFTAALIGATAEG